MRTLLALFLLFNVTGCVSSTSPAPTPLYVDPVYDGAADPSIIYNPATQKWNMFYTIRRANVAGLTGVTWVHGTPIGIAESEDGRNWHFLQTANITPPNQAPTLWAPDIVGHNGVFHMYLTVVPGIFDNWSHPRHIQHYTSKDLLNWHYESTLKLNSDKVIDADVITLADGRFRLFYNDEPDGKSIYYADSADLYHWQDKGKLPMASRGEGPVVFYWQQQWWMIIDAWRGLAVFNSDDALHWQQQPGYLLATPGVGKDDGTLGHHADVVIHDNRAFLFYFTHPFEGSKDEQAKRSVIQVSELKIEGNKLTTDRDEPVVYNWR